MRLIINGFMGGLGSAVRRLAEDYGAQIAAGVDISGRKTEAGFPVFDDINCCDAAADAIIECSAAHAVGGVLDYAVQKGLPIVICTTGLTADDDEKIRHAAEKIPVFKSANMSVGVNVVKDLLASAVKALDGFGFDIEIVEKHHNKKMDAPSGTALMLADTANAAAGGKYRYAYGRPNEKRKRTENEIGMHSIRGGTIFGEHDIIFAGRDEVIEISHTALSRDIFAAGALKAAASISRKPLTPGVYGMDDLLK